MDLEDNISRLHLTLRLSDRSVSRDLRSDFKVRVFRDVTCFWISSFGTSGSTDQATQRRNSRRTEKLTLASCPVGPRFKPRT